MAYPGCVNGVCDQPYDCQCLPGNIKHMNCKTYLMFNVLGWTGRLCDKPETELFGDGDREGKCQPVGAFMCFNGGVDICVYNGTGVRIGDPVCSCPSGFWGTWCEQSGIGARVGGEDIINIEGVEPRNTQTLIESSDEDLEDQDILLDEDIIKIEKKIQQVEESLKEQMGIRAIHSGSTFNSGKLIENLGMNDGLH